jgi:hypothetical protein
MSMTNKPAVIHGDCLQVLAAMPGACIDSIVTDPPYELGFMGKKWDGSGIAFSVELWTEALRVLKPGGHPGRVPFAWHRADTRVSAHYQGPFVVGSRRGREGHRGDLMRRHKLTAREKLLKAPRLWTVPSASGAVPVRPSSIRESSRIANALLQGKPP